MDDQPSPPPSPPHTQATLLGFGDSLSPSLPPTADTSAPTSPDETSAQTTPRLRVAIIGAGPAGISALAAFRATSAQGLAIPEVVCFEKQPELGGTWNLSWRVGVDEFGEPVHSSMYRHLWSNGPKECLELPDFTFDDAFGQPLPSYPPRAVIELYLKARAAKLRIAEWCRFLTAVRFVEYDEQSRRFTLTAHDLAGDRVYTEHFDKVIVATGHFSVPEASSVKAVSGLDGFAGRIMHSHDFRDASQFAGQDVLLVGASESGEDLGQQLLKFGARRIVMSYRSEPLTYALPPNWSLHPLLVRVSGGRTCHFADGSSADVDAIILCTGYKHHFPFLPDALRLRATNRLWIDGLHEGVAWEANPSLFYIGMADQYFTFPMFDAQAWWARDVIMGRITLPSADAMRKNSAAWRAREDALQSHEECIRFQADHLQRLLSATDYPPLDVRGLTQLFLQWEADKHEDFFGFRDKQHRSVITGTLGAPPRMPWTAEMDDSAETFLALRKQ